MIITLSEVKVLLGISDSSYDTAITAILPFVDAKVKQITRRNWSDRVALDIANGETEALIKPLDTATVRLPRSGNSNVGNRYDLDIMTEFVQVGQSIAGTGVPDGTYIADVIQDDYDLLDRQYEEHRYIELSNAATATGSIVATIGMNIAYLPIVAKLAWWMIQGQSTDTPSGSVASKSLGDISVSYSQTGAELDGRFGVPQWAVRGLPRYGRGY
jgi:hypothetical protein